MGKDNSVTIGYKYFLGMHMAVCHGPVDNITRIDVGNRTAWSGNVTTSSRIYINAPDLFGGEKKEGGILGDVDILMGEATQTKNDYLVKNLGSVIPAFRGIVSFVLRQCFVASMSPYPKPWSFLVKRIPSKTWYAAKADIGGGANAAHIIYETISNMEWGMGYGIDTIDDASFRLVADQLYAEGLGLSFEMTNTDSIESFIQTVVKHINGIFYTKPDTGKFALKLLRDDYDINTIPEYNESNIIQLDSFERPSFGEMVNEIVVTFRPQGTSSDDSVTVQDIAAIHAQEGVVSQAVNYPGIDNVTNAARVAMRDLRQKSTPLARVKLKVLRSAWNRSIGDVIKFSWAEHGVSSMVLRVLGVNLGDLMEGGISLDCIEDVFGLPNATYIGSQPSGWVDPVQAPQPATYRRLQEATYWDIARSLTEADFSYLTNTSSFVTYAIGNPSTATINFEFWSRPNGGTYTKSGDSNFVPHGTLTTDITQTQTEIVLEGMLGPLELILTGKYALLDNEIVRIDAFNATTGAMSIRRGCLDTVPVSHLFGARLYFSDGFQAADLTEYSTSETINAKCLTRTGQGLLPINSATQDSITLVGRFAKPYPPGNFKINNTFYPTLVTTDLVITWSHRDRTQQLGTMWDYTAGNIGPEVGTTYSIEIRKASDNSLLESSTGITTTTFASGLYLKTTDVIVTLWSVNGGRTSFQEQIHQFTLNNPHKLITDTGDFLITDAGDNLIL